MRTKVLLLLITLVGALSLPFAPEASAFGGLASAPLSVSATAIAGGIQVGWSAPTDVDSGVTGYRVEYSTSGTSGTWTLWATVGSSTYSSNILGLSQTATYVRVAATTLGGTGIYGYPWTELYRTTNPKRASNNETINYVNGFGLGGSDVAATLNNTSSFTRVKYHMEATLNSVSSYADTDFYKWSGASLTTLQVPTVGTSSSSFVVQTNVTDLNVYSNNSNVTKASGISGRLEHWGWNYDTPKASDYANGDANKYDYNDTNNGNGTFGSFQVHDISNFKTVFAWNYHHYTGLDNPNLGFGNNAASAGHPDWTFCIDSTAQGPCVYTSNTFMLQIFINLAVTPLADATPPTVSRIDARTLAKNGDTITVSSNELGTVYLIRNTVSVSNLASITGAAANLKSSVSISSVNINTTLTTSGLLDGTYNLYAADLNGNISTAISSTLVMDSTAPTFVSAFIGSNGYTMFVNVSENLSHSSMGDLMWIVNDSGTALVVGSVGIGGSQIQISFNRPIPAGATVSFRYDPTIGAATGKWIDSAGNALPAIPTTVITNNSTALLSISLSASATINKKTPASLSISAPVAGLVTFTLADKRIPGCISLKATGTFPVTVTCNFKSALVGNQVLKATLTPSNSSISPTSATLQKFISKRIGLR